MAGALSHTGYPRYAGIAVSDHGPTRPPGCLPLQPRGAQGGWQLTCLSLYKIQITNSPQPCFSHGVRENIMAFLILVIGDLHIPDRALDIPAKARPSRASPPHASG